MTDSRAARRYRLSHDPLGWLLAASAWVAVASFGCGGGSSTPPPVVLPSSPGPAPGDAAAVATFVQTPPTWSQEPARPEGRWVRSAGGVAVWAPEWLSRDGALLAAVLTEVDTTPSQPDALGRPGIRGVPRHMEVIVQDPGAFSTNASPTGLARGMTNMTARIWVSFRMRPYETTPLLPALGHELLHVATGDAGAGH